MFEHFNRAKKELKKKLNYSCFAQKLNRCPIPKRADNTIYIITTNKTTENRHNGVTEDFFKHLPAERVALPAGHWIRRPSLNSFDWMGSEQKYPGFGGNFNNSDPNVDFSSLDSNNIILAFIKILFSRQTNRYQKRLPCTEKQNNLIKTDEGDQHSELFKEQAEDAVGNVDVNKTRKIEEPVLEVDLNTKDKIDRTDPLDYDIYSLEKTMSTSGELLLNESCTFDTCVRDLLEHTSERKAVPAEVNETVCSTCSSTRCWDEWCEEDSTSVRQSNSSININEDFQQKGCDLYVNTDDALYPCSSSSEGDFNGYQHDVDVEKESVGKESVMDEAMDDSSSRIIFNSQPTGSPDTPAAVFICSKALLKMDALHFGESASSGTAATDYNVNAVNKSDGDWKGDESGRNMVEVKQTTGQTNILPEAIIRDGDGCSAALVSWKKYLLYRLGEIWQQATLHFNTRHPSPNGSWFEVSAVVLMTSLLLLMLTGNVCTFLAVLLDVVMHATLLSLLLLVAVSLIEANETGNSTLLNESSILGQLSRLLSALSKSALSKTSNIQPTADSTSKQQSDSPAKFRVGSDECGNDSGLEMTPLIPSPSTKSTEHEPQESMFVKDSSLCHSIEDSAVSQSPVKTSFAETLTETAGTSCVSCQTDPVCEDEEAVVNYLPIDNDYDNNENNVAVKRKTKRSVESQANIDARKIYDQVQVVQQRHQRNLRRIQRKFFAVRRNLQKHASNLKVCDQQKGQFLAKLQLTLPGLQREKNRLSAEKVLYEKQFCDQKKKNQDLVSRIAKLNQQFQILGQSHHPVVPINRRPQFPNQMHASNSFRTHPQQQDLIQSQQQQNKGLPKPNQQPMPTAHIMMPQPQSLPCAPNKWLNNLQHCPLFHPPQQNIPHHQHQSRLPIFQMIYNSSAQLGNPVDEISRSCKQPETAQHQPVPSQQTDLCSSVATSIAPSFQHADPVVLPTRDSQ